MSSEPFRILSLDGGGAKGFYTLGVLKEVEALLGVRLCEHFQLIFGTSTGAIIAALLGLGRSVEEIHQLYNAHVVSIMAARSRRDKSQALRMLAGKVFGNSTFDDVQTGIGIVAARWLIERPMIFKGSVTQAHGRRATFVPGFGCTIGEAVEASSSAYPFFERKFVDTAAGDRIELVDGGYCANNPTLYAIADATVALGIERPRIRVLNVGVGEYPQKKLSPLDPMHWINKVPEVQLLQKTFDINTHSMDQLRSVLFGDVATVRISDAFTQPQMATDLFESDLTKLNLLRQRGSESFALREQEVRQLLTEGPIAASG